MKLLLSLLILISPLAALAYPTPVSGIIQRDNSGYFLNNKQHKKVRILAAGREVQEQLHRLHSGDAIRGQAQFTNRSELILHAIDFVGLQRLIGRWSGSRSFFEFKSFAEVSYSIPSLRPTPPIKSKYAITPSEGANWKVFFSDSNQVSLGTLRIFSEDRVQIYFHDSETGEVTHTANLVKNRRK